MKIFNSQKEALFSNELKKDIYLNSFCPYKNDLTLCGNWCALFFYEENKNQSTPYVILGCKSTDKMLYIDNGEEIGKN